MTAGLLPVTFPPVRGLPDLGRCRVIGVVNVTPDSFSDGGLHAGPGDAVRHGLALVADGADIIDVGGESTRPGATRVDVTQELDRVLPVVRELAAAGITVSVDTTRAAVAERALGVGARMVNDVSGGRADPAIAGVVAAAGVPYVLMHSRGPSADMQHRAAYDDVVTDVVRGLAERLEEVLAAGVATEQVVVDPGIGFAKTAEHSWTLLARVGELVALGRPVLVGASRKAFLGALLAGPDGIARPASERDEASAALSALMAYSGAWAVRVHDVRRTRDAVRVAAALRRAGAGPA